MMAGGEQAGDGARRWRHCSVRPRQRSEGRPSTRPRAGFLPHHPVARTHAVSGWVHTSVVYMRCAPASNWLRVHK